MLSALVKAAMAAAARSPPPSVVFSSSSSSAAATSASATMASRSLVTRATASAGPLFSRAAQQQQQPKRLTVTRLLLPALRASYAADAALDQTAQPRAYQPQQANSSASIGIVSAQAAAAASPNSITLLGKLNAAFEIRAVPPRAGSFNSSNNAPSCVATSQLAFSVGRDKTEWVAVEAWGALAEAAAASGLAAGDRVLATGRLRCNEYSDRQTGQKRRAIKVTLDSLSRVHDGPGGIGAGAGGEWGDQSQLSPGEWGAPSLSSQSPAAAAFGAAAAPAPPSSASLPSWPAPDAGVDWNAAAVVPETPQDWSSAAAAAVPDAAAAAAVSAWGGVQQGEDALAWGTNSAAVPSSSSSIPAPAPAAPNAELAPWDSESPESWGSPSAVPAAAAAATNAAPKFQQQQQPAAGGGGAGQQLTGEQKWGAFFADPGSFWDNRLSKRSPRAPDFKHKVTGEGLWVASRDTPAWVEQRLGELPPPRPGKF